jgi:hypothetical protein
VIRGLFGHQASTGAPESRRAARATRQCRGGERTQYQPKFLSHFIFNGESHTHQDNAQHQADLNLHGATPHVFANGQRLRRSCRNHAVRQARRCVETHVAVGALLDFLHSCRRCRPGCRDRIVRRELTEPSLKGRHCSGEAQGLSVVADTSDRTVQGAVLPHAGLRPNQLAGAGEPAAIFAGAAGGAFGVDRIRHEIRDHWAVDGAERADGGYCERPDYTCR